MDLSCDDFYRQQETPQLFLIQSKQQYLLLLPFLGHILLPCRYESTETTTVSDMTVNLRRQPDSSGSKRYSSGKCVCAHANTLPLPYTVCASISTPINQLYVHHLERFPECVSNHIKHTSNPQQANATGIQLQGKNLKQLLSISLSSLCMVCLEKPRYQ